LKSSATVEVVGEPAAAGAEDQQPARRASRRERGEDLGERGGVLLLAPAPVAMQVGIVVCQALAQRQAGAEREVHLVAILAAGQAERLEQPLQQGRMGIEGGGLGL
jgi:hypothetical protein